MMILHRLFIALAAVHAHASPVEEDIHSWLISEVLQYYHTDCVFLLYFGGTSGNGMTDVSHKIVNLQKKAINGHSTSSVIDIRIAAEISARDHQCRRNRPMYIYFMTDETDTTGLNKAFQECSAISPRWLVFVDKDDTDDIFLDMYIPFDCELLVAQAGNRTQMQLTEMYRINRTLPLQMNHWGTWSPSDGLHAPRGSFFSRRRDLKGAQITALRAFDLQAPPEIMGESAIRCLQSALNFSYTVVRTNISQLGVPGPNGTWNGLLGFLQRGEVDLIENLYLMSPERFDVAAFSTPFLKSRTNVYIKQPEREDFSWSTYLTPFSTELWLTVIVSVIVISLVMHLTHYLGRRFIEDYESPAFMISFTDILHYNVGIVCSQGHWTTPCKWSGRFLYFLGYLTAVVLYSSYSANLVAHLAVQLPPKLPFTSLKGLLYDGTYGFMVRGSGSHIQQFQKAEDPIMKTLFTSYLEPHLETLPNSFPIGLHEICRKEKTSFLSVDYMHRIVKNKLKCKLLYLPDAQFPVEVLSMALQKKSPYRNIITQGLEILRTTGLLGKSRSTVFPKKLDLDIETTSIVVSLPQVTPLLIMWILITSIAAVTFAVRNYLLRRSRET